MGIVFVVVGLLVAGMKGLLAGMVLNAWFSYFINIWLVSKHIGYRWQRQLLDILPVLLASLSAAAVSYGVGALCSLSLFADGALKLVIFMALYVGWSLVFRPEPYRLFSMTVKPFTKKLKRKIRKKKK